MSDKPSYLGLINAIAVGESRAHAYLTAWAQVTPDADVRAVLCTVAAREGEHGMSFAKRVNELGYSVREKEDPGFAKRMRIASSDRTDLEKMEKLGLDRLDTGEGPDIFDDVFNIRRQRVIDNWSWRHTAERTVEQYRALLERR